MRELDDNEKKIVRELVRNPRLSDNEIARRTKIQVMTVNRKRKIIEKENLIQYLTTLDTGEFGTQKYMAKQLYIIKFRIGITREEYLNKVEKEKKFMPYYSRHISFSYLGEKDGHLALIILFEAESDTKIMDDFNGIIINNLKEKLGDDCIKEITTTKISNTLRRHHNYLPTINMEDGFMKKDWPDDWIFVG